MVKLLHLLFVSQNRKMKRKLFYLLLCIGLFSTSEVTIANNFMVDEMTLEIGEFLVTENSFNELNDSNEDSEGYETDAE